jgi:2-C-methyl-D-erythritol 4-phosphate cytidylyltransferase
VSGLLDKIVKASKGRVYKPFCTAIIAAAGSSSRMGGENKIFSELDGVPVIARTLMEFETSEYISEIIIVTQEDSIVPIADICAQFGITKATKILCGGEERIDSVFIGVTEASSDAEYIAVHDGARPLVTQDIITDTIKLAYKHNAAAPAVPVNDTIKVAEDGIVIETPDRSKLFAIQTPQVFKSEILKAALQNAKNKNIPVTDDCSAVEAMGAYVALSNGSFENLKITTPIDLAIAETIVESRKKA